MASESTAESADWATLYHEAFRRFKHRCLWNLQELENPEPGVALRVAHQLRYEGDMESRRLAERIEQAIHAA